MMCEKNHINAINRQAHMMQTGVGFYRYYMPTPDQHADNEDDLQGPYRLYHHEDNPATLNIELRKMHAPFIRLRQSLETILDSLIIDKNIIGSGGYGCIFKCEYDGKRLVAKLPKILLNPHIILISESGRVSCSTDLDESKLFMREMAVSSWSREFRNAERILDSPEIKDRNHGEAAGYAADSMSYNDMMILQVAAVTMKRHPGYAHLHKLVHYIPEIPCILSEYCDGSVHDLMCSNPDFFEINVAETNIVVCDIWRDIAYQVGQAMLFLRDRCKIAHGDIKPANIFYNNRVHPSHIGGRYHFCLGDYGICAVSSRLTNKKSQSGTRWFNPPPQLLSLQTASSDEEAPIFFANDNFTKMEASVYSYGATLLSILNLHGMCQYPPSADNQYLCGFYYNKKQHPTLDCMQKLYDSKVSRVLSKCELLSTVLDVLTPGRVSSQLEKDFNSFQTRLSKDGICSQISSLYI